MVLLSRKPKTDRILSYQYVINRYLNHYVKNGSVGDLDFLKYEFPLKLPKTLKEINGFLDLEHANICELPNIEKISEYFDISYTNITKLPDNLTILRWASFKFTKISELPKNLKIYGSLNIIGTKIEDIPVDLFVAEDLFCTFTPLAIKISRMDDFAIRNKFPNINGKIII